MSVIEELAKTVEDATTVEESVHHLLTGVFRNIKEALSSGNMAAVEQCVNAHMQAQPVLATAVTANTAPATDTADNPTPPAPEPRPPGVSEAGVNLPEGEYGAEEHQ
jgi:hypothetical protein